jgi:hypothetical protein
MNDDNVCARIDAKDYPAWKFRSRWRQYEVQGSDVIDHYAVAGELLGGRRPVGKRAH